MSPDELGPARITQTRDTFTIRRCSSAGLVRAQFLMTFPIFFAFFTLSGWLFPLVKPLFLVKNQIVSLIGSASHPVY